MCNVWNGVLLDFMLVKTEVTYKERNYFMVVFFFGVCTGVFLFCLLLLICVVLSTNENKIINVDRKKLALIINALEQNICTTNNPTTQINLMRRLRVLTNIS